MVRRAQGASGDYPKADLSTGEWVHLPKWEVYVRRDGSLASAKTLPILVPSAAHSGRLHVAIDNGVRRTTVTVDRALRAAFGNEAAPKRHHGRLWTPEEETALRDAKTWADACAALPGRTRAQVRDKGKRMNLYKPRAWPKKTVAKSTGAMMREAAAVVPRGVPPDERADLIADLVTMRLEGRREPFGVLLKEARRERNRIMGTWSERSLDAQIGDHDGFSLMDRLDSEGKVW